MLKNIRNFVKKETVLSAAAVLAVISCFFVPPDAQYAAYIDFRTLALLFSLMAVMAGLRAQGVFFNFGKFLLSKTAGMRQVIIVLVMLCFFSSMIITNDVALITFVPFTFAVLGMMGTDALAKWTLPVVCMQTIAANLGSMLTPIGNPQNLYLYGKSGLSLGAFIRLMLPYTIASLVLLLIWIFALCREKSAATANFNSDNAPHNTKLIAMYAVLFALCLLTVMHVLPYYVLLVIVLVAVAVADRTSLTKVDYSLLFTFIGFFIFIGNLGRVPAFSSRLCAALSGREVPVSVLASQVISNVPAALLLSGFTDKIEQLIVGTNLGGLGTLIASMASLISFRQIAEEDNERKGKYFAMFTISNVVFLALLMALWFIIK